MPFIVQLVRTIVFTGAAELIKRIVDWATNKKPEDKNGSPAGKTVGK